MDSNKPEKGSSKIRKEILPVIEENIVYDERGYEIHEIDGMIVKLRVLRPPSEEAIKRLNKTYNEIINNRLFIDRKRKR